MQKCEEVVHAGTCYAGPDGLEWLFPTIFAVLVTIIVITWIIPATRPAFFSRR